MTSSFEPATHLYGKEVFNEDEQYRVSKIGILEKIITPFTFVVSGVVWEVGQTDDMWETADGSIRLHRAYKSQDQL